MASFNGKRRIMQKKLPTEIILADIVNLIKLWISVGMVIFALVFPWHNKDETIKMTWKRWKFYDGLVPENICGQWHLSTTTIKWICGTVINRSWVLNIDRQGNQWKSMAS